MDSRTLADRWLRPEMARLFSGIVLAMVAGLVVTLFATNRRGETALGSPLGADFGQFHVAGMILNEGHPERLYDLDDQDRRLHQLVPSMAVDEHLPFAYPPFLALLFRPLARLPFAWSFAAWLAITAGAHATAVGLTLRRCDSLTGAERTTAWLLALSFAPFAVECCLGGQLSSLGCLAVATALALRKAGRPGATGLVLSILLYKPTLLLLILPMLVVGRCWRVLAGFSAGAAILALTSWLVAGVPGCLDFLGLMVGYGRLGGSVGQGFKTMKYVDLTAFLRLLGVGREGARPLAIALGIAPLIALIGSWARIARGRPADLAWAATLCWTPVLNVYGPIYDVTVIVPGLLLAANEIRRRNPHEWPPTFRWLVAVLSMTALITQPSALKLGFQPLTLALAAMGSYFLRSLLREGSSSGAESGPAVMTNLAAPVPMVGGRSRVRDRQPSSRG